MMESANLSGPTISSCTPGGDSVGLPASMCGGWMGMRLSHLLADCGRLRLEEPAAAQRCV